MSFDVKAFKERAKAAALKEAQASGRAPAAPAAPATGDKAARIAALKEKVRAKLAEADKRDDAGRTNRITALKEKLAARARAKKLTETSVARNTAAPAAK